MHLTAILVILIELCASQCQAQLHRRTRTVEHTAVDDVHLAPSKRTLLRSEALPRSISDSGSTPIPHDLLPSQSGSSSPSNQHFPLDSISAHGGSSEDLESDRSRNPNSGLGRRAITRLSLHDIETSYEPMEIVGPEGCTALCLFGWNQNDRRFVTGAHIKQGENDNADIERAVLQAIATGGVRKVVVTVPLQGDINTFQVWANDVVDTVVGFMRLHTSESSRGPFWFRRLPLYFRVQYYELSLILGSEVAFLPEQHQSNVKGFQISDSGGRSNLDTGLSREGFRRLVSMFG